MKKDPKTSEKKPCCGTGGGGCCCCGPECCKDLAEALKKLTEWLKECCQKKAE
ncbi:MAG TPA: hypothetical protein VLJ37_02295 [bacterium]|nr:hypothetical protein [bacterium]